MKRIFLKLNKFMKKKKKQKTDIIIKYLLITYCIPILFLHNNLTMDISTKVLNKSGLLALKHYNRIIYNHKGNLV